MRINKKNNGAVFLVVVFAIALIATITMGILVMTTEEVQIANNQVNAVKAVETAEAGLNDAFYQIRSSSGWTPNASYTNKAFHGDTYTVAVTGTLPNRTITSTASTAQGYTARVSADVTIGTSSPYKIRIDKLRINE